MLVVTVPPSVCSIVLTDYRPKKKNLTSYRLFTTTFITTRASIHLPHFQHFELCEQDLFVPNRQPYLYEGRALQLCPLNNRVLHCYSSVGRRLNKSSSSSLLSPNWYDDIASSQNDNENKKRKLYPSIHPSILSTRSIPENNPSAWGLFHNISQILLLTNFPNI